MTKTDLTTLVEELRKTVEMQAETIKVLLALVAHMNQPQITLVPQPPVMIPLPAQPSYPYMPYIGDPPAWPGPGPGWVTTPNIGTAPMPNMGGFGGTHLLGSAECRMSNTQEG